MKNMLEIPDWGRAWVENGKWYADNENLLSYIEDKMYDHFIGCQPYQDQVMLHRAAEVTGAAIISIDETRLPQLPPGAVS